MIFLKFKIMNQNCMKYNGCQHYDLMLKFLFKSFFPERSLEPDESF